MSITQKTFEEIAARKGRQVHFSPEEGESYDMEMVEASLKMAIQNLRSDRLKAKLTRVLTHGTDADKLAFVLSDGAYHIPGDVATVAEGARHNADPETKEPRLCYKVCEVTWYVQCRFLNGQEFCREISKRVCEWLC